MNLSLRPLLPVSLCGCAAVCAQATTAIVCAFLVLQYGPVLRAMSTGAIYYALAITGVVHAVSFPLIIALPSLITATSHVVQQEHAKKD